MQITIAKFAFDLINLMVIIPERDTGIFLYNAYREGVEHEYRILYDI